MVNVEFDSGNNEGSLEVIYYLTSYTYFSLK
jgi:hypothetical protein